MIDSEASISPKEIGKANKPTEEGPGEEDIDAAGLDEEVKVAFETDSILWLYLRDIGNTPFMVTLDQATAENALAEQIQGILPSLSPRQVHILQLRHGLASGEPHMLEEVGQELGITRERVRQIEAQAISRIRHSVRPETSGSCAMNGPDV